MLRCTLTLTYDARKILVTGLECGNSPLDKSMIKRTFLLLCLLSVPLTTGCNGCEEEPTGNGQTAPICARLAILT